MFDPYSRSKIADFPEFDGPSSDDTARALSRVYFEIVSSRIRSEEHTGEESREAHYFLRRLVNAVFFQVVLNENQPDENRKAAAFVAAEASALLADLASIRPITNDESSIRATTGERLSRVESALLYLFAEYDACALGVLRPQGSRVELPAPIVETALDWMLCRVEDLCGLKISQGGIPAIGISFSRPESLSPQQLEKQTTGMLIAELGYAATEFGSWLSGTPEGLTQAQDRLDRLIAALAANWRVTGGDHDQAYHLAVMMRLCIPSLADRALVYAVPTPQGATPDRYRRYLVNRAMGTRGGSGRPILWPSTREYVRTCLGGSKKHSVVSMPTGSGKSFLAELAVSQATHDGWALYLAPTNALTQQIRGDLREGLSDLGTEIFAFIGDQEYSIFSTDRVHEMPSNSVAVMTPEKCSLALRLSPSAFANCKLVVFDECHLLGDTGSTRGPVAELVLAQLMLRAQQASFLLMSAIVANPNDLAEWLGDATGVESVPVSIKWRPTRTLRGVLGVDKSEIPESAANAIQKLKGANERIRRRRFSSGCAVAVNLQGAWQSEDQADYAIAPIDCDASLVVRRKKVGDDWKFEWTGDSWVNNCAISLGQLLVRGGVQTIVFTPSNRHYPFSNGRKVAFARDLIEGMPEAPPFIDVCRRLAEFELGVDSEVFALFERGVATHTSLMLETEKIASELMFRSGCTPLMFATGTLAQGLNLPAIAVVIAGSRIGDTRGQDKGEVMRRKFSQLLNAAGRAGRAGFANQGVVIAIPDKPVAFAGIETFSAARDQVDYLQQSDDAVPVGSGLAGFVDAVANQTLSSDAATDLELLTLSLLVGGDDNQLEPGDVVRRSYAAFIRRTSGLPDVSPESVDRMRELGTTFIRETQAPPWLTVAAQRAGLDFFLTLAIANAWGKIRPVLPEDIGTWEVTTWRDELMRVVSRVAPGFLLSQLPLGYLKYVSGEFKSLEKSPPDYVQERSLVWEPPSEWSGAWETVNRPLDLWMRGESLADIARVVGSESEAEIPSDRVAGRPIPSAIAMAHSTWSGLSLIAGGLLAIAEAILDGKVPRGLASLPMCIKYGLDSPERLAWFRFGVRLRRPSRLLAQSFPPPRLESDEELRDWVRERKQTWLRSETDESSLMAAIRQFVSRNES